MIKVGRERLIEKMMVKLSCAVKDATAAAKAYEESYVEIVGEIAGKSGSVFNLSNFQQVKVRHYPTRIKMIPATGRKQEIAPRRKITIKPFTNLKALEPFPVDAPACIEEVSPVA